MSFKPIGLILSSALILCEPKIEPEPVPALAESIILC